MKKLFLISIIGSFLLSCGTSKSSSTGKTAETSGKKTAVVSAETKQHFHNAMHGYIIRNLDNALKDITTYISKNPKDDAGYFLLSKIYYEKQDSINSLKALETARNLDKENKWYNVELGYAYLGAQEYQKALEIFLVLTKKEPDEPEYQLSLLQCYYGLKKYEECLSVIDRLETITGKNPESYIQRYTVYAKMKKYDQAEKTLLESIEQFPEEDRALFALNDFYTTRNQKQKMISYLEEKVAKNPENGSAALLLAEYYLQQNNISKAGDLLEKTYADPSVEITYKRYFLLDNYVDRPLIPASLAQKLALKGTETNPEDGFFSLLLGDIYDKAGDIDNALFYYKKAMGSDIKNKEPMLRIVFLEYQRQEYDSLVFYSKKALEFFPSESDLYYFNALGLLKQKKYDECIDAIDNGIVYVTDAEGKADFNSMKGEAYFGKKEYKQGREVYDKAIKENPKNDFLKNNLALVLAKHSMDLDYAMKLVNEVLITSPKNQNYQYTRGLILFKKENYSDAQNIFEELLKTNEKDATLYNALGDVYFKKGYTDSALDYWKKAKELGSKSTVLDKKIEDKKYYEEVD